MIDKLCQLSDEKKRIVSIIFRGILLKVGIQLQKWKMNHKKYELVVIEVAHLEALTSEILNNIIGQGFA